MATYAVLGMIAVVYAGTSWAMAAHAGTSHVVAAAAAQSPGLLSGLGGSGALFFARDPRGENLWRRLIAPTLAAAALGVIVVLAVLHDATLLGVPPGLGWALGVLCP